MQPNKTKNILILCNVLAGAGKAVLMAEKIVATLANENIVHKLFKEDWPKQLDNFSDVFIVGGDGTLHYFINQYPAVQLPLVIFKAGTGNDFQWLLYGDKTFDEQMHIALNGPPKPIDMGQCNQQYFINGVGIGFEGEVAKALVGTKKLPGKTSFLLSILKKIVSYRSKEYDIQCSDRHIKGKKFLVDVSNGRRAGGGFHISPEAKPDDGLFDVVLADALSALKRLRYLPVIEKGKHLQLPFIHCFNCREIVITSAVPIQYHLDGEYFEAKKLVIQIHPAALQFRY